MAGVRGWHPLRHLTQEQKDGSINNHKFSRKHSQTNMISILYWATAVGICWFSVILTGGIIKVFCRSPAQAVARGSHCRRGSETQGYLWITHWFPCDWCRFWELLRYLHTISREYTGAVLLHDVQVTSKVWMGPWWLRNGDQSGDILPWVRHSPVPSSLILT